MRIPTGTKSGQGRARQLTAERLVNLYAEEAPGGSKSPAVVHGTPGLSRFADMGDAEGATPPPASFVLFDTTSDNLRTFDWPSLQWVKVGNTLNIPNAGTGYAAGLSRSRIAFIDGGLDLLRTYEWDGTDWSQVGNALTITGLVFPSIAAMSSDTVAMVDTQLGTLRTYKFDGTDWAQVGNSLAHPAGSQSAITALTSDTVVTNYVSADTFRVFKWDGTNWTQQGSSQNIPAGSWLSFCAITSNRIAYIDNQFNELRCYEWDGNTWSLVGSGLSITTPGNATVSYIEYNTVALIGATNNTLQSYYFDGSAWSTIGGSLSETIANGAFLASASLIDPAEIGKKPIAAPSTTDRPRGLYRMARDGKVYLVAGQSLYHIAEDGTSQQLGVIAGSGRVGMADNGDQLCIVTGAKGYIYDQTNGLQTITDKGFPGAETVAYLDGFFIFNNPGNGQKREQFFISKLRDGLIYDALDFASAEAYPDNLKRVVTDHSELILFGEQTTEIWFNAGAADFPFRRAQGSIIEKGLGATWSVAQLDESVMWLDQSGIVRRLQGGTPVRMSTHAIEHKIKLGDWENAVAWSYYDEGHNFYVLTIPRRNTSQTAGTYVYDAATGVWHERKSKDRPYSRSAFYVAAYGKHLTCDIDKALVYDQSLDVYTEDGEAHIAEMTFPQVQNDGERFIVDQLWIDMEVGVEAAYNQLPGSYSFDPADWGSPASPGFTTGCNQIAIGDTGRVVGVGGSGDVRYSDDKGSTWSASTSPFGTTAVRGVAWGNGKFMAVADSQKVAISSDGISWTLKTAPIGASSNCAYGAGVWVAAYGTTIYYSSNEGTSWTASDAAPGGSVNDIDFGGGQFIAAGASGTICMSSDGISWTTKDLSAIFTSGSVTATRYLDGQYVAGGFAGKLAFSSDGSSWTQVSTGLVNSIYSIAYGEGMWYAGTNGGELAYSADGTSWTVISPTWPAASVEELLFHTDTFIGAVVNSPQIITLTGTFNAGQQVTIDPQVMLQESSDGRTWGMLEEWHSMGKQGEYSTRVKWDQRGQHSFYTPKISISSPVKRAIFSAYAKIRPTR